MRRQAGAEPVTGKEALMGKPGVMDHHHLVPISIWRSADRCLCLTRTAWHFLKPHQLEQQSSGTSSRQANNNLMRVAVKLLPWGGNGLRQGGGVAEFARGLTHLPNLP